MYDRRVVWEIGEDGSIFGFSDGHLAVSNPNYAGYRKDDADFMDYLHSVKKPDFVEVSHWCEMEELEQTFKCIKERRYRTVYCNVLDIEAVHIFGSNRKTVTGQNEIKTKIRSWCGTGYTRVIKKLSDAPEESLDLS